MNRAGFPAAPRGAFWIALFCVLILSSFSPVRAQTGQMEYSGSVNKLMKMGQAAEQRDDWDTAYNAYQAAAAKNSRDIRARTAMYRVRPQASGVHMAKGRQLLQKGDEQGALTEFLRAEEIDPTNEAAGQEIAVIRQRQNQAASQQPSMSPEERQQQQEINSMASPVQLKPVSNEPLTLHFASEDAKNVYQAIGRAAGINVLFDPDYNSKRIQVDLQNSTLMDALRIVGVLSNTFWQPITPNTIFVAQNTRSKRTELEEYAVQTFYLTNAWQQNDLNDVQTALRNVLTNIKVYGLASQNALVVRGTPDELLLAQKLISDLDKARPEVVVDVAVMEVSKNWERNLGLQWPSSASVALQSTNSSSSTTTCPTGSTTCTPTTGTSTSPTFYDLAHLNSSNFAVTIGSATANLLLTDSNTRILQNPRLRATDMQKATLKVGERIPIATGSFSSGIGVGAAVGGGFPAAETQFQYIDVGVTIEITPTVHWDRDITLKMKIEVTAQAGSSTISGVTEPIIAQKSTEEVVRLREGEANILSGILNQQDQVSWSGIPGLSSIPILKYLFGSKDHTISNDEVVFLMVPHLVRDEDVTAANLRPIDTGPGQNVELRRIAAEGPGANAAPQIEPVTTQSTPPHPPVPPGIATVPGQSASAAAPVALDQMRAAAGGVNPVPQTNLQVQQPTTTATGAPPPTAPPGPAGGTPPQSATSPAAPTGTNPAANPAVEPPNGAGGKVKFMLSPPGPVANGATFQVPVVISNASDIVSVPLQIEYDPAKLSMVNVGPGDFLSRDGQSVALVHRDDGPGTITVNASRPPGAPGVSGAGVVCMLTFQAKAAGPTMVVITKPGAMASGQKPVAALGAQISLTVR
ncbi:MAG TPA: cohesin domain-containing protein [Terracidiphilus sp.]|jgi:general secretion pathway protein D|nr:cohesin domain-containing protein [Terracidiphilus sp.]